MINNRPFPSVREEKRERERRICAWREKRGGWAAGGNLLTAEIGAEKGAEKWESRVGRNGGSSGASRGVIRMFN